MRLEQLYALENATAVRVTYRDTDQMGVAYYANHLVWFEIGRTELVRQLGKTYRQMEAGGVYLPVVEAHVNYRAPARYDDLITIHTRVVKLSHVAISFAYRITREDAPGETVIAEGSTRHGFVARDGRIYKNGFEILGIER